jgi:hypothetical protein
MHCENKEPKKDNSHINEIKRLIPLDKSEFYINLVENWIADHRDGKFLICGQNKSGDFLVALYHYNAIYLLGEAYPTIMYAPKILFHQIGEEICIDDVLMKHNNIGNGSIAMSALFKYASAIKIKQISGFLSEIDDDHKERRNHYYEKFGFLIKSNRIIKNLI